MNKTLATLLAPLGLLGLLLGVWVWGERGPRVGPDPAPVVPSDPFPRATTRLPESAAPARAESPDTFSDPQVRALVAGLYRMLSRSDVRAGEAVLAFKDAAALARFLARADRAGLTIVGRLDSLNAVRVRYDSLRAFQDELARNAADYSDLSGNYTVDVPQVPAKEDRAAVNQVPFGNNALSFIGANGDRSQWGRGITIAILDTGVAADATFGSGRLSFLDVGLGVAPGAGTDDGHGTSVASLAAGQLSDAAGVAAGASLLSIRVTDAQGTSDIFTLSSAIIAATDAGAKVINVSLGGYGTNSVLDAAIGYATRNGAVIVAAAGNDQAAQLAWPAADPRVLSVGAVDRAEQQVTFSNSGEQLQLTAPGYGVQSAWTDGSRAYVSGTSASAPLVAGAVATLMSQNPSLTASAAAQLLTQTASDVGLPGDDPDYGHGILNLNWALNATNPGYVDTAVASHYYDAATNQMNVLLQNRSGHAVYGLSLAVANGPVTSTYTITQLAAGQTEVVKVPVDRTAINTAGQIRYSTTLSNPLGVVDQQPSNNRRSSVLTVPKK